MVKLKKGKKGIRAYAKAKQNVTVNVITNKTRRAVAPAGNRQPKVDPMIQALSTRPQFVSLPTQSAISAQQQFTQNVQPYLDEYLKQKTLVDTKPKTLSTIGIQTESIVDEKEEDPIQVALRKEAEDKFDSESRGRSLERSPSGSRPPPFNPQTVSSSSSSSLDPRIANFITKSTNMLDDLSQQIQDPLLSKKDKGKLQKQINTIAQDQQFMAKGSQSERDTIFRKNLYKR